MTNCGRQPLGRERGQHWTTQTRIATATVANGSQAGALENGAPEIGSIFNDW